MLAVCCLVGGCSSSVVRWWLFVVRRALFVVRCLAAVRCVLFAVCCGMFAVRWLLVVVIGSWFAVCCCGLLVEGRCVCCMLLDVCS